MHEFQNAPSNANGVCQSRLLIGEANPILRDHMLAILRADGHEVVAMGSGIDLLDTLAVSFHPEFGSGRFDLVIADARMVGADNAKVFCTLGGRAKIPPFVFTTVYGDKDLDAKMRQFGALAVVEKPLDMDDLRQIVNRSLHYLTADSIREKAAPAVSSVPLGFGRDFRDLGIIDCDHSRKRARLNGLPDMRHQPIGRTSELKAG